MRRNFVGSGIEIGGLVKVKPRSLFNRRSTICGDFRGKANLQASSIVTSCIFKLGSTEFQDDFEEGKTYQGKLKQQGNHCDNNIYIELCSKKVIVSANFRSVKHFFQ